METVLSNVVKEKKKSLKGSTFGNTNRKEADMPMSAAEHLLTERKLEIAAMTHR